jgi:hypothetical protein
MGAANVTGDGNVAIGQDAGQDVSSGDNNTFVGSAAGNTINFATGDNTMALGNTANPTAADVSNEVTIGNTSISTARVQVDWTVLSDERDKKNIQTLEAGLDFINALRPVSYNSDPRDAYYHWVEEWDDEEETIKKRQVADTPDGSKMHTHKTTSFLAQEVMEAIEEFGEEGLGDLVLASNPDKLELQRTGIIVPLVKAVQELSAKVTTMQEQLDALA